MNGTKVNFFIVGAAKSGTTSLYHYLSSHPEIFMSLLKETNYFSSKEIIDQNLFYKEKIIESMEEYEKLFLHCEGYKAIGEASVSYLYYPAVAEKIHRYNPTAKIIILLRHPTDRAISHHAMDQRLGWTNLSLPELFERKTKHPQMENYFQQYFLLGNYHDQVKRYLDVFGKEKTKIIFFETVKSNIIDVTKQLYQFLDVSSDFIPNMITEDNAAKQVKGSILKKLYQQKTLRKALKYGTPSWLRKNIDTLVFSKAPVKTDKVFLNTLNEYYKQDIDKLSSLLQTDLSHWKSKYENK